MFPNSCSTSQRELDRSKADTASSTIKTYIKKDKQLMNNETALMKELREKTESLETSLKAIKTVDIGPRIESDK